MTRQVSFTRLEQAQLPGFRERLDRAESPDEVRREGKKRLDIFSPGGGFVFTQIHNILAGVPPENVVAMYRAACE